ncbi:unnamed protein product [Rhizopus stolonifer]
MKLSVSVLLLATVFATIQAASVSSKNDCTRPNNRGEGQGLGWNGYCCKTSDDCKDACVKGVCNGKNNPKFAEPIDATTTVNPKYATPIATTVNPKYATPITTTVNPKYAAPITTTVNPKYATPI